MHKLPPAQEIFNKVSTHLLTQGRPAREEDRCRYRTTDGLFCAVGCLIPDELYSSSFEGKTVIKIIRELYAQGRADWLEHQSLLEKLQWAHDENPPLEDGYFNLKVLRTRLTYIAELFKLEFSA